MEIDKIDNEIDRGEEKDFLEKPIEINLKKLKLKKTFRKLKKYKIPIFFGVLGLFLIGAGVFSLYFFNREDSEIKIIPAEELEKSKNKEIIVDVSGAVFKPGVYKLKEGDRLQDALIAAGGMSEEADREWVERNLNLAVRLVDGNKVYIPKVNELGIMNQELRTGGQTVELGSQTKGEVAGLVSEKININTASAAELDTLPGVGEKTAAKIIAGRPYQKIEDLVERKIIYKSTFEKIKEKITVY